MLIRMKPSPLPFLIVLTSLLVAGFAHATTRSYNCNSVNTQWSVAANWSPVGVPQNGDVLVFGSLAGNRVAVNDLSNLKLNAIQITDDNYNISGNSITLSNGITATSATLLYIYNDIALAKSQTLDVDGSSSVRIYSDINLNGFTLTIDSASYLETHGAFTGTGTISKYNSGELLMAGSPNTFSGSFVHVGGQLSVAKSSCLPASYTSFGLTKFYNSNATDTSCDITLAPGATMTANSSVTNTIRHLTVNGALLEDTKLHFVLRGNLTNVASTVESRFYGHFELSNTNHIFHVNNGTATNDLVLAWGSITGGSSAGFTKTGTGKLYCHDLGSSQGGTNHIKEGIVEAGFNANILGAGKTVIYDGASIQALTGSSLTSSFELIGAGVGGTNGAIRGFGLAQVYGSFLIMTSATVCGEGALHLSGNIGGFGTLHIGGTNEVWTEGASANTLIGGYRVDSGTFVLNKPAGTTAVGSEIIVGSDGLFGLQPATLRNYVNEQIVSHVFIATSGRYELNGKTETVPSMELNNGADVFMDGGTLILAGDLEFTPSYFATAPATFDGGGYLNVGSGTRNLIINDTPVIGGDALELDLISTTLSGSASILKKGDGDMRIRYDTAHTGTFTIEAGDVEVTTLTPFGTAAGSTVVTGPGALVMSGSAFSDTEPMTFNGTGRTNSATLVIKDATSLRAPMTLSQNTRMFVTNGAVFTLHSPISGAGALVKEGLGEMYFDWDRTNTFTGGLWVKEGLVTLARGTATNLTIPSALTIGDGSGAAGSAHVLATHRQQIANTVDVTVHNDGRFTITNMNEVEIIRRLQGPGQVYIYGYGLRFNDSGLDSTFDGTISGTGDLFKAGTGKFTHTGNCNASGLTFSLYGGETTIDGTWNASPTPTFIDAWSGTILSGNGTMQDVLMRTGATLAPGSSPGILTMNNLTLSNSANLFMELRGTTPGTQHDQIVTKSSINVSNATLTLSLNYPPVDGDVIRLVDNQSANPILGNFSGKPQGSIVTISGNQFVLSYTGGTGNDITLTVTNSKLALETALVTSGNGIVDAGECNELYIVLNNQSGGSLSGVTATLDSRSPGIAVSQQNAVYPNFTAGAFRTNTTPFRISSLPGFACGQRVDLQLTVTINGGSSFAIPVSLTTGQLGSPTAYSTSPSLAITDMATVNSTMNVAGFPGYVNKVTVSMYVAHTFDADLDIYLQAPSGKLVKLVADRGGSGNNFGTNCSPNTARTTFDDTSRNSIASASAPFQGTFSPEESLADFKGELGNGAWKLVITDDATGDVGTLNCWTLTLYTADCGADAASACESCNPHVFGTLTAQSPTLTQRLFRDANPSVCGETKLYPGVSTAVGSFRYATHTFTNTGASGCVTLVLQDLCANQSLLASAYSGSFNPADLSQNYLADIGTNALASAMSFYVPSNGVFTVVVNELIPGSSCPNYTLDLFGLRCPPPTLNIERVPADKVRVYWNAIGSDGYTLRAAPTPSGNYTNVPTAPAYENGFYTITNSAKGSPLFFRLGKP
jgi:subtilisin-like proprotein convertase family protein